MRRAVTMVAVPVAFMTCRAPPFPASQSTSSFLLLPQSSQIRQTSYCSDIEHLGSTAESQAPALRQRHPSATATTVAPSRSPLVSWSQHIVSWFSVADTTELLTWAALRRARVASQQLADSGGIYHLYVLTGTCEAPGERVLLFFQRRHISSQVQYPLLVVRIQRSPPGRLPAERTVLFNRPPSAKASFIKFLNQCSLYLILRSISLLRREQDPVRGFPSARWCAHPRTSLS